MGKTGGQIFDEYRSRMGQSGEKIKQGVLNTDKSQSKNAIKAKEKMVANLTKSLNEGKWEKGLAKAGDEKWANGLINKGIGKIVAGIDNNSAEIKAKFDKVAEVGDKVRQATANMPNNNVEEAINKVRKNIDIQRAEWGKS